MNIGVVCALTQAGMLSTLSKDREKLVFEAQVWGKLTDKEKTFCLERGAEYEYDLLHMVKNIHSWVNDKGKKVAAKTRLETIRANCVKHKEIYYQNKGYPTFACWWYEKKLLGYSYTTSLKNVFKDKRPSIGNIMELRNCPDKTNVEGVFEVVEVKKGVSGRGNKYLKMTLQDETGTMDGMMVGFKYEQYAQKEEEPKKGDIIYIIGQASPDIIWINNAKIQNNKIYLKLSDMK